MGILIAVLAFAVGWWVYEWLTDEFQRQRWREAQRDLERRRRR